MSELVENVRGIIEAHIAACEPPDAIARATIAAVIEFLYVEAGRSVCPGAAAEYLSATFLEKQIEGKE